MTGKLQHASFALPGRKGFNGTSSYISITPLLKGAIVCQVHRVHHILSNGGSASHLIYHIIVTGPWTTLSHLGVVSLVKRGASARKLSQQGIDPDLLGSHSLKAGGVMALNLQHSADTSSKHVAEGPPSHGFNTPHPT